MMKVMHLKTEELLLTLIYIYILDGTKNVRIGRYIGYLRMLAVSDEE